MRTINGEACLFEAYHKLNDEVENAINNDPTFVSPEPLKIARQKGFTNVLPTKFALHQWLKAKGMNTVFEFMSDEVYLINILNQLK